MRVTVCFGLILMVLGCGNAEKPEFSPLIRLGEGGHDLTVVGIDAIRSAELAPGAEPARPVIEGGRAVRTLHFLATYARDIQPREIGEATIEALVGARFTWNMSVSKHQATKEWTGEIEYEAKGATGTLSLRIRPGDAPNRLELLYRVEETLRDQPVDKLK